MRGANDGCPEILGNSEFFQNPEKAMKKLHRRLHEVEIAPVGPAEDPKANRAAAGAKGVEEPLHKRVIKRAEQIRSRWTDIPTPAAARRAAAHGSDESGSAEAAD